jgi:hypothetical protein
VTETLILGLAFIVVGGLAVAHAVYTLRNRPKRDQGWWWGQHPLLTGLIAGWPVGYTGRLRARVLLIVGLGAVAFGCRLLLVI